MEPFPGPWCRCFWQWCWLCSLDHIILYQITPPLLHLCLWYLWHMRERLYRGFISDCSVSEFPGELIQRDELHVESALWTVINDSLLTSVVIRASLRVNICVSQYSYPPQRNLLLFSSVMTVSVYSGWGNFDTTTVLYFIQENIAALKTEVV